MMKVSAFFSFFLLLSGLALAQENSPYTRYGLGDPVPSANISQRGMGGISAAFYDYSGVNALNPASYGLSRKTGEKKGEGGQVTFDLGIDANTRTIRESASDKKYNSAYGMVNYLNISLPVKKGWGLNIGFAPETRINYKVANLERLNGIDSVKTTYNGTGGVNKVFTGLGWSKRKPGLELGLGLNLGYLFGRREVENRRDFINDTVVYYSADYKNTTTFGNLFGTLGLQWGIRLQDKGITNETWLRLGAYAQVSPALGASQDLQRLSIYTSPSGAELIDTVAYYKDFAGTVKYPSTIGFGAIIEKKAKWLVGVDVVSTNWGSYRNYATPDNTANTLVIKLGAQLMGKAYTSNNSRDLTFFKRMIYRAGFQYGSEPYSFAGQQLKFYSGSLGLGIPLISRGNNFIYRQSTMLNFSFEFGARGSNTDVLKENFMRVGVGFSLSDWWFVKAKYY